MIVFRKLRFKNFLSAGNTFTELDFQAAQTTLIIGKNGGGKSTVIDALHYALYGKAFRSINKPQLVNSINQKNMLVELEFNVGKHEYLIRRGAKPAVFEVHQDGTLINQNAESKEYQDVLEKNIVKMTPRTFSQIVVLGSAEYIPFMRLPTGQRRGIIEDLLDIQMFSIMNTLLKERILENQTGITDVNYKMKGLAAKIDLLKSHVTALEADRDKLIEQKQAVAATLTQKKEELTIRQQAMRDEVSGLLATIGDAESVVNSERVLQETLTKIQTRIERLAKEIKFYTENDSCPTCKQGIAHDHKNTAIEKDRNTLEECETASDQLANKLQVARNRLIEIKNTNTNITFINREDHALGVEIKLTQQNIDDVLGEIENIRNNNATVQPIKDELKERKKELQAELVTFNKLNEQKQIYDVASILLKDTGIKTKIIKQYIPVINKLINKYLASMDFFVNFELNENFEEVIKSRHRDEFTYSSFSEGEKARLDIAILFTWRAIAKLRNSASTNLLIMDEVFDGSLDTTGNDELLKIITDIATDSNIVIISHRSENIMDKFQRTIKFEKSKNFSEMSVI